MSTEATHATDGAKTRGRPRTFDNQAVLDELVQLFWQQGYEATSMADIVKASGLSKSSLYNTFGSKDELFEQALNSYVDTRSSMLTATVITGTRGLDDIEALFEMMWAEVETMGDHRGCLAVNTSTELGLRDARVVEVSLRYRTIMREALQAALERAAKLGEIEAAKVGTYTNLLVSFILGTAVIVRSGASNDEVLGQLDAARSIISGWRID